MATLLDAQPSGAGDYAVPFATTGLAAGLYHYRLTAAGHSVSRALSIVR